MIVLENIVFELFQLLIAKWTAVMTIDCFLDACFAIYMATSRYVAIIDWIETYCALKLSLQLLWVYFEVYVILSLFADHFSFDNFFINNSLKIYKKIKEL